MLQREREREERGEGWQPLTPLCYYLSLSLLSPPSFFPHSLSHFNSAPLNISLFLCTLSLVFFLFSLIGLFYYSSSSCFCSLSSFPSHHYSWQHVFPTKFSQSSSFFLVTTLLHQPLTCILFISGWIQDFSTLVELQIYWKMKSILQSPMIGGSQFDPWPLQPACRSVLGQRYRTHPRHSHRGNMW